MVGSHPLAQFLGPPGEVEAGAVVAGQEPEPVSTARATAERMVEAQFVEPKKPAKVPNAAKLKKSKRTPAGGGKGRRKRR